MIETIGKSLLVAIPTLVSAFLLLIASALWHFFVHPADYSTDKFMVLSLWFEVIIFGLIICFGFFVEGRTSKLIIWILALVFFCDFCDSIFFFVFTSPRIGTGILAELLLICAVSVILLLVSQFNPLKARPVQAGHQIGPWG